MYMKRVTIVKYSIVSPVNLSPLPCLCLSVLVLQFLPWPRTPYDAGFVLNNLLKF